ncbi:hypothetical protein [Gordonia sp. (in: high G+C Gram-positive bacteria)]|uniref:hypothetical protein n=1 Tax=Gordonia sp. (in: high G+C Gram-positive bacteria) TaxID=84139 RepID=UPI003F9B8BF6
MILPAGYNGMTELEAYKDLLLTIPAAEREYRKAEKEFVAYLAKVSGEKVSTVRKIVRESIPTDYEGFGKDGMLEEILNELGYVPPPVIDPQWACLSQVGIIENLFNNSANQALYLRRKQHYLSRVEGYLNEKLYGGGEGR